MIEFGIDIFNTSIIGKRIKEALDELSKTGKEYDVELSFNKNQEYPQNSVLIIRGEYQLYGKSLIEFFKNMKAVEKFSMELIELHIVKSVGIMSLEKSGD